MYPGGIRGMPTPLFTVSSSVPELTPVMIMNRWSWAASQRLPWLQQLMPASEPVLRLAAMMLLWPVMSGQLLAAQVL